MDYVLFLGFKRIGSFYPNAEEAKRAINQDGIWNICGVNAKDGKLVIVTRESVVYKTK